MNTASLKNMFKFAPAVVAVLMLSGGCAAQSANQKTGNSITAGSQAKTGQATGSQTQGSTSNGSDTKPNPGLLDPSKANEKAPDVFYVQFDTTKGPMTIRCTREWAPNGADRFYNMVKVGYFSDIAIFRGIKRFMFQFGIHGDPAISAKWSEATLKDDPAVGKSNLPMTLSFAQTPRPNSRSVQIFVNLGHNAPLDGPQRGGGSPFVPFAEIISGKEIVSKIHLTGENPRGVQERFKRGGNDYIKKQYPQVDFIKSAKIVEAPAGS